MPIYLDEETTSLHADIGILVCIGIIAPSGKMKFFFANNPSEEPEIIKKAVDFLKKFSDEKIYVWNTSFDIPFLITRAIKHGIDVSLIYDLKFVDLCKFVRENLRLASNKLDEVVKFLELDKNLKKTGKDVHKLYLDFLNGNKRGKDEIIEHCKDDLLRLKEIHERVKPYVEKWEKLAFRNNFS